MLKVSVAMTTYNGEKFILEQLISLYEQNRKPDEVFICDDGSTDKTIEIIENFIDERNLKNHWFVEVNKKNKGYTKNFLDCASMTTGDVIFFCDQDDIWHPDKIKKMTREFELNEAIKAMGCTFTVIDNEGKSINTLYNKLRMGNGELRKMPFSKQVKNNISVGLTLAIKRENFNIIKPIIIKYNLPFDVPVGLYTSSIGGYYILGEPLVYRRVHNNNVSSPKYSLKSRLLNLDKHIEGRAYKINHLKMCYHELSSFLNWEEKENLKNIIGSLELSLNNLKARKALPLFFDIFSINPMQNRLLSLTNFLCALFSNYDKVNANFGQRNSK